MKEELFITFILPSRSRPEKFYIAINNIISSCDSKAFEIIAVLDQDDIMYSHENLLAISVLPENVHCYFGKSEGKVSAVNRELDKIDERTSIVILHSDDFLINKKGFDSDIREAYADGFMGAVHFYDNMQKGNLITYPILHKSLIDHWGYIYNPEYYSVYPDDEMSIVVKIMGLYRYIDKDGCIIHNHWRWGLSDKDELYERNDSNEVYAADKEVFMRRKINNFDIV